MDSPKFPATAAAAAVASDNTSANTSKKKLSSRSFLVDSLLGSGVGKNVKNFAYDHLTTPNSYYANLGTYLYQLGRFQPNTLTGYLPFGPAFGAIPPQPSASTTTSPALQNVNRPFDVSPFAFVNGGVAAVAGDETPPMRSRSPSSTIRKTHVTTSTKKRKKDDDGDSGKFSAFSSFLYYNECSGREVRGVYKNLLAKENSTMDCDKFRIICKFQREDNF